MGRDTNSEKSYLSDYQELANIVSHKTFETGSGYYYSVFRLQSHTSMSDRSSYTYIGPFDSMDEAQKISEFHSTYLTPSGSCVTFPFFSEDRPSNLKFKW
jgi:hypothetical protein